MAIARSVDRRLFFLFDRAHARLSKAADQRLRERADLGAAQGAVLAYLGYNDGCRLTDLAQGVGHNSSAITALIARMEAAGLTRRKSVLLDGRAKTVHLTEAGWERRAIVMDVMRDFNAAMAKGFSESDMEIIFKFLGQAEDNISPQ